MEKVVFIIGSCGFQQVELSRRLSGSGSFRSYSDRRRDSILSMGALPCKESPECLHKSLQCYSCNESQSISGSLAKGSEVQRSPHRYWNIDRVLGDPVES
ncbi:hypothetical protein T03_771 [Trichinella britovi]|uniref:Uncharacterized protein n=1 Tax=Trichinella britovi TaxID=45882 RepID=A0A0V1D7G0_TRIBR|nr:hypothetical protein T03_771 [Trichinella britovi]